MHYNKSILFLCCLIVVSSQLSAQQSRPGFIVTHESDTVRGQIQNRYSYDDFVSCLFLKDGNSTEYFPSDIQAFGYDDGKFMRSVSEKYFGESLVQGTINLYTTEDQFYVEKEGEIYLLERKFVKTVIDGREGVKEDRKWQGILSVLISDCITNSNEAVSNIKFLKESLIKLVLQYNRCKGDPVPEEEVLIWTGVEIGLLAGTGRLSFDPSFSASGYDLTTVEIYRTLEEWKGKSSFFGMFADITFPNISNVFSLHTEFILVESSGSTEGDLPSDMMSTDVDLTTFQLLTGTRATFPQRGFVSFFDLGIQLDMERESTTSHQVRSTGRRRAQIVNNSFEINGNAIGMYMGAGLALPAGKSRASVQVRYTRKSQGTNDQGDLSIGVNQWHFLGTFSGLLHRKSKG